MSLLSHKTYLAMFLGAFGATYVLVPAVRWLSDRLGAFDLPSARRVHGGRVPTLGGLAIAIPLYVGLGLLSMWPNAISEAFFATGGHVFGLLVGGAIVVAAGVYDDVRGLSAGAKLSCQILAALVTCAMSRPVALISLPLVGEVELGIAAVPLMVFWIVAVTNAFNLIDGIDGLAAGVGALVCAANFFIAHTNGHVDMMVFSAIMAGALLGFLRYNFHPAKIFLGDTGSLFLGFTMATVSLQSSMKTSTTVLVLVPVCILGYPLLDTTLAVVRRAVKGKPIFSADRSHIHHKLLASGLGHQAASAVGYGLTIVFVSVAVLHLYGRHRESTILLVVACVVLGAMFSSFGYWGFVRYHFSMASRRKYRVYNMVEKTVRLKMLDARDADELWGLVCYVAKEFDLHSVRLVLDGLPERQWVNPAVQGSLGSGLRRFRLSPGAGTLLVSHNGHCDEDIELEQNLLLERVAENLGANIRRLNGGMSAGAPAG